MPKKKKLSTQEISNLTEWNPILVKIDDILVAGVDYDDKLTDLAYLAIPGLADVCCLHLLSNDGSIERAVIAPHVILKTQALYDWLQNDLPNDETDGLPGVFSTKKSVLVTDVNPIRRAAEAGIRSYLIVPLVTGHKNIGALTLLFTQSERNYDALSLALAENLAMHLSARLEYAQIYCEQQQLNAELEKRVDEGTTELQETLTQLKQTEDMIQTLFRVSNKLNATLDVDMILDTLAQEAIQIVDGESGFAGLRTPEGMNVHRYFQNGVAISFEHTWGLGESIPGWVLKYKVPYGTSDAENDPLFRRDFALNANVHSIICTPILDTMGEVIAYFDIRNKRGEAGFTINDQEMLLTLAPVASIAIQNALAYQERLAKVDELKESSRLLQELAASLEKAREEERLRIARELHDELGQALTALKFDLAWLSDQLEENNETLAQKAHDISSQTNNLIKVVRRIATELRPGMIEDLGLVASIEWQAQDFEKRAGIECSLSLPSEDLILAADQALAIYRIFQEGLTNVARYAQATHVEVKLLKSGELLTLMLHDNGQGIKDEDISSPHSIGLLGMRERAKYIGGTVDMNGVPGQGTTLIVTIPISTNDIAEEKR
jgi:signal transduction histidine kinase